MLSVVRLIEENSVYALSQLRAFEPQAVNRGALSLPDIEQALASPLESFRAVPPGL